MSWRLKPSILFPLILLNLPCLVFAQSSCPILSTDQPENLGPAEEIDLRWQDLKTGLYIVLNFYEPGAPTITVEKNPDYAITAQLRSGTKAISSIAPRFKIWEWSTSQGSEEIFDGKFYLQGIGYWATKPSPSPDNVPPHILRMIISKTERAFYNSKANHISAAELDDLGKREAIQRHMNQAPKLKSAFERRLVVAGRIILDTYWEIEKRKWVGPFGYGTDVYTYLRAFDLGGCRFDLNFDEHGKEFEEEVNASHIRTVSTQEQE